MFEQAFKNIDDVLWKEAGCTTELDYTEQTSWLLFLKYLDGLEQDKADEAALDGKKYAFILDKPYRWEEWAAPKGKDGQIDHNKSKTGDDLHEFVNQKLFPYLHGFRAPLGNNEDAGNQSPSGQAFPGVVRHCTAVMCDQDPVLFSRKVQ